MLIRCETLPDIDALRPRTAAAAVRLAAEFGITPPIAEWTPHSQVRALSAHDPRLHGIFAPAFAFADAFAEL